MQESKPHLEPLPRAELLKIQNEKLANPFWPSNGVCWHCQKDVLSDRKTAIEAEHNIVTGCRFCNRSFVE